MQPSPECQAHSLGTGCTIAAQLIRRLPEDPALARYHHFHPAAEVLWFRRAEAVMHTRGLSCRTGTGDLVYLPSMTPHDFEVERGATAFALIFHDPAQEKRLPPALQARLLQGPLILRADPLQAARIDLLADWLVEATAAKDQGTAAGLLDLLLRLVAEAGELVVTAPGPQTRRRDPLARLERAIALIHSDPARPLSLTEAAAACNLSAAYFARLFRARMGQTFSDYLQRYRLNLAAQLAGSSDLGIAEIAWRTGFASPAHLSARFTRTFGLSPSRYRAAAHRNGPAFPPDAKRQDGTSLSPNRDKPAWSPLRTSSPKLALDQCEG